MWVELGHRHILYVPGVSNIVTTGNGTGTKNIFEWSRALQFVFSIQFSVYVATTAAKLSPFSIWTWSTTVSLSVEIDLYSCE